MANLAYQQAKLAGQAVALVAAAGGGDKLPANPSGALLVRNADASDKTVTVVVPGNTEFGQAEPDVAVVVAAGTTALIGPLPASLADPNDHLVHVSYSGVTGVSVAAIQI